MPLPLPATPPLALNAGLGPCFLRRGYPATGKEAPPRFVAPRPAPAGLAAFAVAAARAEGLGAFAYGDFTVVLRRPREGRGLKRTGKQRKEFESCQLN